MRIHDKYLCFSILVARELKRLVASLWHWTSSAKVKVKKPILFVPYLLQSAAMFVCRAKTAFFFLLANSCIVFMRFYRKCRHRLRTTAKKERSHGVLLSCYQIDKEGKGKYKGITCASSAISTQPIAELFLMVLR